LAHRIEDVAGALKDLIREGKVKRPDLLAPGRCPKYEPTTSGEHLRRLFVAIQVTEPATP
jgi:hypothetical protein